MSSDADRALTDLYLRAADALDAGRAVPCLVDPEPFSSEERAERLEAAAACSACPVLVECARAALVNGEPSWVWGGVDLTPSQGIHRQRVLAELAARGESAAGPARPAGTRPDRSEVT